MSEYVVQVGDYVDAKIERGKGLMLLFGVHVEATTEHTLTVREDRKRARARVIDRDDVVKVHGFEDFT